MNSITVAISMLRCTVAILNFQIHVYENCATRAFCSLLLLELERSDIEYKFKTYLHSANHPNVYYKYRIFIFDDDLTLFVDKN